MDTRGERGERGGERGERGERSRRENPFYRTKTQRCILLSPLSLMEVQHPKSIVQRAGIVVVVFLIPMSDFFTSYLHSKGCSLVNFIPAKPKTGRVTQCLRKLQTY